MSSTNQGSEDSGASSRDRDSELKLPASRPTVSGGPPVVPDAPTVIRPASSSEPSDKERTAISGGGLSPFSVAGRLSTKEIGSALEGEMLGSLRLDRFIGGGGMGAVFRAHDTNLRRTVAVKILSRGQGSDGELKKRFQLEAQSAARLDHENIARVFYVGEHEGWNYIVFEYIDGVNIRDLVNQQGPRSVDDAVNYTLQIAEALHHASCRDVVHRDIKPSNVLVTSTGRAKLVDMGLARLHQFESGKEDLTASGVTLGTFDYISPEQARDPRSADVRSDVYSLGCTLFFMLSGQPPFSEGTVLQKLLSHTSDDPPDICGYRTDVPAELAAVLCKMLAKTPGQRQQTASQLIGELLLVVEQFGLKSAERSGTVWVTPSLPTLSSWERHIPWLASVVLLFVIVFGLDLLVPGHDVFPSRPGIGRNLKTSSSDPDFVGTENPQPLRPPEKAGELGVVAGPGQVESETVALNEEKLSLSQIPVDTGSAATDNDEAGTSRVETSVEGGNQDASYFERENEIPDKRELAKEDEPILSVVRASERSETESRKGMLSSGQPTLIVVGPHKGNRHDDMMVFAELATAIHYLHADPQHAARLEAIELRFSGRQASGQRPLDIRVPQLVVRAGQGFEPILAFNPTDFDRTTMITLYDSKMALRGVHCELDLPYPVDQWSLFSLQGVSQLTLQDSTLTMRNSDRGRHSFYENAVCFHLAPRQKRFSGTAVDPSNGPFLPVSIHLENSVVRGEATVVRAVDSLPLRVDLQNSFLITTERLLEIADHKNVSQEMPLVKLSLNQTTAVMDRGLCQLVVGDKDSEGPCVQIHCEDSTLLTSAGESLIRQKIPESQFREAQQVHFEGDHNVFLTVAGSQTGGSYFVVESSVETVPLRMFDFQQWCHAFVGLNRTWKELAVSPFVLPANDRPVSDLLPSDYSWGKMLSNGGAQKYGLSAGVQASELPRVPASLEVEVLERAESTGDLQ